MSDSICLNLILKIKFELLQSIYIVHKKLILFHIPKFLNLNILRLRTVKYTIIHQIENTPDTLSEASHLKLSNIILMWKSASININSKLIALGV